MRSINIKRAAAVVAGAAMVASVITPALAAVGPTQADVDALVANIKANPADTKVIIGTNGAAISDGLAAAKIAAVLASLNYEITEISGDVTGDKSVTVSTSGSAASTPTTAKQYVELTAGGGNSAYASAASAAKTITRDSMGAVLGQDSVTAAYNQSALTTYVSSTYYYEDKIILGAMSAKYSEDAGGNAGWGLYLSATYPTFKYKIDFGTGIPIGTNVDYQETPQVNILGKSYGLDWKKTSSTTLSLFTGEKQSMVEGDSITQGDYTLKFTDGTRSGSTDYGMFSVTAADGTVKTTANIKTGDSQEFTFGTDKVTVTADYVGYDQESGKGYATVRLGTGTQSMTEGSAFTLDDNWTVDAVDVAGTTPDKLTAFTIKYGNPAKTGMKYNYQGSYLTGLKAGDVVNGPLTGDGTALFGVKLVGFGSQTTSYKTTDVVFTGSGTNSSNTTVLNAKWYSRDGALQTFNPTQRQDVVFEDTGPTTGGLMNVTMDLTSSPTTTWTIINDKAVKFIKAEKDASTALYTIRFEIGGQVKEQGNVNGTTGWELTYGTINPLRCNVTASTPNQVVITNFVNTSITATGDTTTGTCDMFPNVVPFGTATDIAAADAPYMNLYNASSIAAGNPELANATLWTDAGSGDLLYVTYDGIDTKTTGQMGMKAGNAFGGAQFIDQTVTTYGYDKNQHEMTGNSTVMDGTATGSITMTVSDAARNALVEVAGTSTATAAGQSILSEGEKISGVTIDAITCPSTSTVSGTYYTQKSAMSPENLVALDSAAAGTYQIVVGGPYVNTIANAMTAKDLIIVEGASYVYAEGDKLLVAGYSATDTTAAVNELIALLKA